MLYCIPTKGQIKENKQKAVQKSGKCKYVTPDQIFVGIADDVTMNYDAYLQLIERSKM